MGRERLDHIRTHIGFDVKTLERLDAIVGPKGRAAFVRQAVDQMLDQVETAQRIAGQAGPKRK